MVLHGRAPTVCTGIKLANPELKPVAIAGDGDALAIGMSHFVHAARRNVDMVMVLLHNNVYGMTGGQAAPDTPEGFKATTAPYGAVENPMDAANIAIAAGATFVARWSVLQTPQLEATFRKALAHKGFSLVEVLSPCPTYFGRNNGMTDPVENLRWIRDQSVLLEEARQMDPAALAGKYVLGELYEALRPELSEVYARLRGRVTGVTDLAKGEKEEQLQAEAKP
jgi:2-oxoglutarate ferredoxin oxidoreductase subunit beta